MRDAVIAFVVIVLLMFGGRFLVARRLSASGPVHVPAADGAFTLRPPVRSAAALALLALVPACALCAFTFRVWRGGGEGLPAMAIATGAAAGAAAYLVAAAARARVVVRDLGMEAVGVFRRRIIGWAAVARIAFNPAQRWFFLTMSDGSHLWLRADVAGIGDFAVLALRRLRPAVLQAADPVAREVLQHLAAAVRKQTRTG